MDLQQPADQISIQGYPDCLDQNKIFRDSDIQVTPKPISPIQDNYQMKPEQLVLRTPQKIINQHVTPETIRPFETAGPRKVIQRGRKPGRTRVLTDTPEKDEILDEAMKKAEKKKTASYKTEKKKIPKASKKKLLPKVFHNLIPLKLMQITPKVIRFHCWIVIYLNLVLPTRF